MKTKRISGTSRGVCFAIMIVAAAACNDFFMIEREGDIETAFSEEDYLMTKTSGKEIPDTNNFVLDVCSKKGESLYHGIYGAAPQSIIAAPGTYEITAVSGEFKAPAFSSPQYGDKKTVEVKDGATTSVKLICKQVNSGVRLQIHPSFLTNYPDGVLFLKSADGKLMYSYTEKRIAYFNPGYVSLILSSNGTDKELLRRELASREILSLNISAVGNPTGKEQVTSGSISIQIDTTREWTSEKFVIGGGSSGSTASGKGGSYDSAMGIQDAKNSIGAEDVWVKGYIVGGDLSSSKASFSKPFTSNTNLVIAARSSEKNKSACMSVQLQKGAIRDALNLVDHPELIGKSVCLRGDIVASYYGIPGIQNISEFVFGQ